MIPPTLRNRLALPIISAPMFLLSNPTTVVEACRAGIIGTFPSLNARTPQILDTWLGQIRDTLLKRSATIVAPYGINLIVHRTNPHLEDHVALVIKHKVPVVITSLGARKEIIEAVHSYNGIVLQDVTNAVHAEKALKAGADGIIAICAGAGGHSGHMSPMALIPQLRRLFPQSFIIAGGAVSDGQGVRALQTLGADLAYMGTRFIAVKESGAVAEYKKMILNAEKNANEARPGYLPVVYTDRISGVHANFLRESLVKAGLDPDDLSKMPPVTEDFSKLDGEKSAWSNIWSAGHGAVNIKDEMTIKDTVDKLRSEYNRAVVRESMELGFWVQRARF